MEVPGPRLRRRICTKNSVELKDIMHGSAPNPRFPRPNPRWVILAWGDQRTNQEGVRVVRPTPTLERIIFHSFLKKGVHARRPNPHAHDTEERTP